VSPGSSVPASELNSRIGVDARQGETMQGVAEVFWLGVTKGQFLSTTFRPRHPEARPPLSGRRTCISSEREKKATAVPYLTVPGFLLTIPNREATRHEPIDTVQRSKAARPLVHTERLASWRYDHTRAVASGQEGKLWAE